MAFGLSLLTMAFAIGDISGCHVNPAVSFGLWAAKRFPASELIPYLVAQVAGAIAAAAVLFVILMSVPGSPQMDMLRIRQEATHCLPAWWLKSSSHSCFS